MERNGSPSSQKKDQPSFKCLNEEVAQAHTIGFKARFLAAPVIAIAVSIGHQGDVIAQGLKVT
jgi:hypothetical protein|tara:strand:- start:3259 stop:3447 length:189 start_codon:yes stop_codon:yes gene_type:complete